MLVGPLPFLPTPAILCDKSTDPGLFGPNSVTWRIFQEPILLAGGGRALLMQVAHPLVGQGVVDHSDYEARPYGRLLETYRWLSLVIFGTTAEAIASVWRLNQIHDHVRGRLDPASATARFPGGTAYAATDQPLAAWVHATLVESILVVFETLVGPLATPERDQFVREWTTVGELLNVGPAAQWSTAAALGSYVADQIARGTVAPVAVSKGAARTVLRPPMPWPVLGPLSLPSGFLTTGLLPEALRNGYGCRWTSRDQRLFRITCSTLRMIHPLLPRRLRVSPLSDSARKRAGVR